MARTTSSLRFWHRLLTTLMDFLGKILDKIGSFWRTLKCLFITFEMCTPLGLKWATKKALPTAVKVYSIPRHKVLTIATCHLAQNGLNLLKIRNGKSEVCLFSNSFRDVPIFIRFFIWNNGYILALAIWTYIFQL